MRIGIRQLASQSEYLGVASSGLLLRGTIDEYGEPGKLTVADPIATFSNQREGCTVSFNESTSELCRAPAK